MTLRLVLLSATWHQRLVSRVLCLYNWMTFFHYVEIVSCSVKSDFFILVHIIYLQISLQLVVFYPEICITHVCLKWLQVVFCRLLTQLVLYTSLLHEIDMPRAATESFSLYRIVCYCNFNFTVCVWFEVSVTQQNIFKAVCFCICKLIKYKLCMYKNCQFSNLVMLVAIQLCLCR